MSVNKVILLGNLGKDVELRTFPDGGQVANVSIATTEKWKDKQSGEMREATEWHFLVFTGRLAEVAAQYLGKGSKVYVEGRIRTRTWEKDGQTHYRTEIRVDSMQMLDKKPSSGGDGYGDGYGEQGRAATQGYSRPTQQPQRQAQAPQQQPQRNSYAEGRGRSQPAQQRPAPAQQSRGGSGFDDMDDDIPF